MSAARAKPVVFFLAGKDPDEDIGGHWSFVRAQARAAARAGFLPRMLCLGGATDVRETDFGVIHRFRSPVRPIRSWTVVPNAALLARAAVRLAREERPPHLFHGFGAWSYAGLLARRRLAHEGRPTRVLATTFSTIEDEYRAKLRGVFPSAAWRKRAVALAEWAWVALAVDRVERAIYAGADRVLVNYESVRRLIERRWGGPFAIERVPYAPESAFLPPPHPAPREMLPPGDGPLVVSVSRHDPRKGIPVLLEALSRLIRRGIRFRALLAGGGTLLSEHRALARRLGLGEGVLIPGRIAEVPPVLARADVFVLPSLQEGSGSLALLEALQAGVASVASACDGIPEDVEDGKSALLVAPGDPAALGEALARLLGDASLRRRIAAAGRARFEERFGAERFAAAFRRIYGEIGGAA